jgi:hypothetical protein
MLARREHWALKDLREMGDVMNRESQGSVQALVEHLRWAGREGRGGMDAYIRVREAAYRDALRRTAGELEGLAHQGNEALLGLAASLREWSLRAEVPADVRLPEWPTHRPVPDLEPDRMRREQQIGFSLGLARGAALIHDAGGGEV